MNPHRCYPMMLRIASVCICFGVVHQAYAQSDWSTVPVVEHRVYQSVNSTGDSTYTSPVPFRLRGVVLNNTEDWLNPAENYSEALFNLGGQAEIIVQAVDLDGTPYDPNPSQAHNDINGTFVWMGQNYGNLPFIQDPAFNYINQSMAGGGETRPIWYSELDRLGYNRPGTPLSASQVVRAGDLVEIRGRVNGLVFEGKHNVNERHSLSTANDYEVVILEKGYGLPDPSKLNLSDVKTASDQHIFDQTRQTGGERYQGELVQFQRVRFQDTSTWGADETRTVEDTTGRSFDVYLGLNSSFNSAQTPWGYFDARGIMTQASASQQDGYKLLSLTPDSFTHLEGDADQDWDVDNSDLGSAFGNFTGPGEFDKTTSQGDADQDGDVDNSDLGQAFGNFTGPVLPPSETLLTAVSATDSPVIAALSPTLADLIYNPLTGEIWLDQTEAAGGIITNFVLGDLQGGFSNANTQFPFLGALKTNLPFEISQTDPLFGGLPTDVWSLGQILPTGMNAAGLTAFLDQATYVGALGTGVQNLDLVVVPEAGSLVLCGLASLVAVAWIRWKNAV